MCALLKVSGYGCLQALRGADAVGVPCSLWGKDDTRKIIFRI